jgi:moderate conductance mechanosensitive channel
MDWGSIFNAGNLKSLVLPGGIGLVIMIVLYVLRYYLYRYIRKLAAKTKTCFDDIMIQETRIPSILWCVWIGLYVGWKIAETPSTWIDMENKVIPVLYVSIGIYTLVMIIIATLKWYKIEICSRTNTSLDDIIMSVLIACTPIAGTALGVILDLRILGYQWDVLNIWLSAHLGKLLSLTILMVTLLLLTIQIVPKIVESGVRNAGSGQTDEELKKRADTLISVIVTTVQIIIIFMFLLMALSEFNINIAALLTGAGVLGLAVGFGAQSLVKDVISGLFIIMENQYRKGDVIKIADISGTVEEINLRRTILRDLDGTMHVIPNGEIKVSSNYTKQWSRVNFNISVAYNTDLEKAMEVINRVGKEMADDPRWAAALVSPPRALRVDKLGDSGIDIRVTGDTKPSRQWDVTGELKLRLKKAFDQAGIEIPYPHTTVQFENWPPQLLSGNAQQPGHPGSNSPEKNNDNS